MKQEVEEVEEVKEIEEKRDFPSSAEAFRGG